MRSTSVNLGATALGALLVIGLVALGAWWAVPSRAELVAAVERLASAPPGWLAMAMLAALAPTAIEAVRIRWVARGLGVAVAARTAIDAAIANSFFTAVTPATGLGEPAVAWMLRRGGVARDVAIAVPLAKFTTSFVTVFAIGAVVFASGHGAAVAWLAPAGALACAVAALIMLAVIVVGRNPARATAVLRWCGRGPRLRRMTDRAADTVVPSLTRLGELRIGALLGLALAHVVYLTAYAAPLALVSEALMPGTGATALVRAIGYLCATFLAPTPGGAGIAEVSAAAFFGDLIGRTDAVIAVISFRIARFVSQVLVCGGYLAVRGALHLTAGGTESAARDPATDPPRADR